MNPKKNDKNLPARKLVLKRETLAVSVEAAGVELLFEKG